MKRSARTWLLAILATGCVGIMSTADHSPANAPVSFWPGVALEDSAATTANASFGDVDGDGDLDLVIARERRWPITDLILLNDGAGHFTPAAELPGAADRTYTAGLENLDDDGDLNIFVATTARTRR